LLGDATVRRADVRVIGATNRDDTVFRVDVRARFGWAIRLPPLRERREDIPLLLRHLLIVRAQAHPEVGRFLRVGLTGELEPKFSRHLIEYIVRQPLPGNTRELREFLRECVIASKNEDEVRLPSAIRKATTAPPPPSDGEDEDEDEDKGKKPSREIVRACLRQSGGNISGAARSLGVHRNTFAGLMKEYGITREDTET
jgi:two-component system nitrogen regulation response regulator GlnG